MASRVTRVLTVLGLSLGVCVALPHGVQAHASLVKCNIARGAVLTAAPKVLACTFAEGVNPKGSFIKVVEATGDGGEDDLGNSAVSFSNAKEVTVSLPKLDKGAYYVLWFTISADDGHKAGGVLPFSIK